MSRIETTERQLFGGREKKIWVAPTKTVFFEKGGVEFVLKLVEFDQASIEDFVMLDVSSNTASELLQNGVRVFQQNEVTRPIVVALKLEKRELLRRFQTGSERDALLLTLVKSLQTFIRWV